MNKLLGIGAAVVKVAAGTADGVVDVVSASVGVGTLGLLRGLDSASLWQTWISKSLGNQ